MVSANSPAETCTSAPCPPRSIPGGRPGSRSTPRNRGRKTSGGGRTRSWPEPFLPRGRSGGPPGGCAACTTRSDGAHNRPAAGHTDGQGSGGDVVGRVGNHGRQEPHPGHVPDRLFEPANEADALDALGSVSVAHLPSRRSQRWFSSNAKKWSTKKILLLILRLEPPKKKKI